MTEQAGSEILVCPRDGGVRGYGLFGVGCVEDHSATVRESFAGSQSQRGRGAPIPDASNSPESNSAEGSRSFCAPALPREQKGKMEAGNEERVLSVRHLGPTLKIWFIVSSAFHCIC